MCYRIHCTGLFDVVVHVFGKEEFHVFLSHDLMQTSVSICSAFPLWLQFAAMHLSLPFDRLFHRFPEGWFHAGSPRFGESRPLRTKC